MGFQHPEVTAVTSPNSLMDTHSPREAEGHCDTKEGNRVGGGGPRSLFTIGAQADVIMGTSLPPPTVPNDPSNQQV